MKVKLSNIVNFVYSIALFFAFNIAYLCVSERFQYSLLQNFTTNLYSESKYLFVFIIYLLIQYISNIFLNNYFYKIIWQLFSIFFLCPAGIYYIYATENPMPFISSVIFLCILLVMFTIEERVNIKVVKEAKREKKYIITKKEIYIMLTFAMIIVLIRVIPNIDKINLNNLFLEDIYSTRYEFRDVDIGILKYLIHPISRVVLPYLIIIGIQKKEWKIFTLSISGIILIFLCGALKSVYLGIIAIILFYKGDYKYKLRRLYQGVIGLTAGAAILYKVFNWEMLLDTFTRRMFFIPARLDVMFYEYFTNNYTYGNHTRIFSIFSSEKLYPNGITRYFGENILGINNLNANVSALTEGYISFGMLGVIVISILVGMIMIYFKKINYNPKYLGLIVVYVYYFNTSFIENLILIHGLGFLIIFSYKYLNNKYSIDFK